MWILLGMSVVAPLLWAIVILLLDLTLSTEVRHSTGRKMNGNMLSINNNMLSKKSDFKAILGIQNLSFIHITGAF